MMLQSRFPDLVAAAGRLPPGHLLCIDELGYLELDRRGAELLFQALTEREEKKSVAIASNESFAGWTKTLTDPRLWAAIVNRLTFGGNIIETDTGSYRLATTRGTRRTTDHGHLTSPQRSEPGPPGATSSQVLVHFCGALTLCNLPEPDGPS